METKSLFDIVAQRNRAVLYCQLVRHCFTVMLRNTTIRPAVHTTDSTPECVAVSWQYKTLVKFDDEMLMKAPQMHLISNVNKILYHHNKTLTTIWQGLAKDQNQRLDVKSTLKLHYINDNTNTRFRKQMLETETLYQGRWTMIYNLHFQLNLPDLNKTEMKCVLKCCVMFSAKKMCHVSQSLTTTLIYATTDKYQLLKLKTPTTTYSLTICAYSIPKTICATQVRRQPVRTSHYHLRSKVPLDLVDRVVDPGDVWWLSFS
jgi:hypothetical protein